MLTSDIKYTNLSTDYERLYNLLKNDFVIVGFCHFQYKNKLNKDFSKLIQMYYSNVYPSFEIDGVLFESDFSKDKIISYMNEINIRYFDIDN